MDKNPPLENATTISSAQNPKVKSVLRLQRGIDRRAAGMILVEGADEIELALSSGSPLLELYICQKYIAKDKLDLLQRVSKQPARVYELTDTIFQKLSMRQNPDGWLAVFRMFETDLAKLTLTACPLIIVCSAVEKPGNLGAILRTADAAGVDAVISTEAVTDWGNPNVIRASRGTVFTVPVAEASIEALVPWLRERGIKIIATSPEGAIPYTDIDMSSPTAIVMGPEHTGLPPDWLAAADALAAIPMHGKVNSLNVATSAALMVYEALRQRTEPAH